jgi:hypothetical protein
MRHYQVRTIAILGCLAGLAMASAALAQAPRSKVDMAAAQGVPEFRDPKTGQVWTPNNVGHDNGPPPRDPADLAFDPQHQTAYFQGVVVQRPAVVVLGTVPITAGPTVPIIKITDAQLRAVPGKRWEVVAYIDNNSGNVVEPVLSCHFTNSGKPVEQTVVLMPPVAGGTRVGLIVEGPKTEIFVDRALCVVVSPT